MEKPPVGDDIREDRIRAAQHFMGQTDIDRGNVPQILHFSFFHDCLSCHSDPVPSFNGDKSLPHLFFVCIQGIIAHILQHFPDILPGYLIGPAPLLSRDPLFSPVDQDQRLSYSQADLLEKIITKFLSFHLAPDCPRQDI